MADKLSITVVHDGPYQVNGGVPLRRSEPVKAEEGELQGWKAGEVLESGEMYELCRCGHSKEKPFCDYTHETIGFDGAEAESKTTVVDRQQELNGVGVTVNDDRSICAHSGFCGNRVTNVWKMIGNTDDPDVRAKMMAMIDNCPSGALSYTVEGTKEPNEPELEAAVGLVPDGPLWVTGGITVECADGQPLEVRNRLTLCRCGASKNKPLCDGSHSDIGFSG